MSKYETFSPEADAWFAVRTHPRKEDLAKLHLTRQGYQAFLPKMLGRSVSRGSRQRPLVPFFPSYLFVRLNLTRDSWRPIDSTIGVSKLVRFGEVPSSLPKGLIERLQTASDESGVLRCPDELKAGDAVTLVGGAFDALRGIVLAESGPDRVQILLELMSRQVRVTALRRDLVKSPT